MAAGYLNTALYGQGKTVRPRSDKQSSSVNLKQTADSHDNRDDEQRRSACNLLLSTQSPLQPLKCEQPHSLQRNAKNDQHSHQNPDPCWKITHGVKQPNSYLPHI